MSRKPRVEFDGAIYHVFQRGNNREYIFKNDQEKSFFLRQVKSYIMAYNFKLFAYVIMNNHFHFILQSSNTPLHKIMHNLNNTYSKYYNRVNCRTGHVFEERYNSKLIDDDSYLLWLIGYIHRNPTRAKICSETYNYKWSSDIFYRKNILDSFVDINFVLGILSPNRDIAINMYTKLLCDSNESKDSDFNIVKGKLDNINSQHNNNNNNNNNNNISNNTNVINPHYIRKSLEEILCNLNLSGENISLIKLGSRKRHLTYYKFQFIKEALEYKYSCKEIGDFISLSQSGVSRIILDNFSKNQG